MSSYYPDPKPTTNEPAYHEPRMYDCLADVFYPDGSPLVLAGDVFNDTMREAVDMLLNSNARRYYYRSHERHIPFQGEPMASDYTIDLSAVDADLGVPFNEWLEMHGAEMQQYIV